MARENYQARLEAVDARRVDEFQEELDIETQAEATRRLLRRGLDDWEREQDDDGQPDSAMRRHGVAPSFSFVIRVAILFLAIFAGGSAWEAGTAFGDFLTVVGVF